MIGPSISTAIGWKEYEAGRSAYLASFLEAAASAAAAAVLRYSIPRELKNYAMQYY